MLEKQLRWTLMAFCMALFGCSNEGGEPVKEVQARGSARNLLLICIDTVRADLFYSLGEVQKDSLSDWQNSALVFKQAVAPASWTLPSLASVFTGLWPVQHGMGQLPGKRKNLMGNVPSDLYEGTTLLAQAAEKQGFKTQVLTASGWTYGDWMGKGLTRGFTEKTVKYPVKVNDLGETVWPRSVAQSRILFKQHTQEAPTLQFLHILEAHNWHLMSIEDMDKRIATWPEGQRELYLDLAPEKTCEGADVRRPFTATLNNRNQPDIVSQAKEGELNEFCKRYIIHASAVSSVREGIATILDDLKADGLLEDTVVVVFADHGEEFMDHEGDNRPVTATGKRVYFGHGQSLYQEIVHVPLMVWHPGYDGAQISQPVSLIDIAPTAARWLDVDFMPEQWQGRFLDDYIDSPQESTNRVIFASGISNGEPQISIRQGAKKGIWYTLSDINSYFDLDHDPLEQQSESTPELVMLFDGHYLDYVQSRPDKTVKSGLLSDEQIKRLQSIGYLQGVEVDDTAN